MHVLKLTKFPCRGNFRRGIIKTISDWHSFAMKSHVWHRSNELQFCMQPIDWTPSGTKTWHSTSRPTPAASGPNQPTAENTRLGRLVHIKERSQPPKSTEQCTSRPSFATVTTLHWSRASASPIDWLSETRLFVLWWCSTSSGRCSEVFTAAKLNWTELSFSSVLFGGYGPP